MARLPASGWMPTRDDEIAAAAARIAALIGAQHYAAIGRALAEYSGMAVGAALATSPTAVRDRVSAIEAAARELRDALSALARDRGGSGAAENAYEMIADRLPKDITIADARRAIAATQAAAQQAVIALPAAQRGREGVRRASAPCVKSAPGAA